MCNIRIRNIVLDLRENVDTTMCVCAFQLLSPILL